MMTKRPMIFGIVAFLWIIAVDFFLHAGPVFATQTHGEPEGLFIHQLAHLFFMVSMGFLAFWLRERYLTINIGWRFIQYAAILLMIWNIDAFTVHMLDEYSDLLQIKRIDNWHLQITSVNGNAVLEIFYYMVKLDHLWCVPALLLLYIGLRRLAKEAGNESITPP